MKFLFPSRIIGLAADSWSDVTNRIKDGVTDRVTERHVDQTVPEHSEREREICLNFLKNNPQFFLQTLYLCLSSGDGLAVVGEGGGQVRGRQQAVLVLHR